MFYSTILAATLAVAAATADYTPPPSYAPLPTSTLPTPSSTPSPTGLPDSVAFWVMSLRSASPVHFSSLSAAYSSLFLNLRNESATCDSEKGNDVILYIKDTELYLYTGNKTAQKVFVDRSGMGQGKIGYVTGANATLGRNFETKGWRVDEWPNETFDGSLSFNGTTLLACPGSIDNSWSVWLALVEKPGFLEGCLGFTAAVTQAKGPVACEYTE